MRNKILTLSLLFVLSFTLTACTIQDLPVIGPVIGKYFGGGTGTGPIDREVTIKVWGLWENPQVMNSLISLYNQKNPKVSVVYEDRSTITPDNYRDRVFTQIASSLETDVVLLHNTWVPKLNGSLTPMPSSMMSVSDYESAFYPVSAASAVSGGKIYAVPFYYDGLVLLYNKDHFAEVGQQEAPTSWEEFRKLAYKLKKVEEDSSSGALVRAGAAMGTATNIEHFSDILGLMFEQTSLKIPQDIATKPAAETLDYYLMFSKTDKVWDSTMPESVTAFSQGKVSMIFVPSWRILDVLASNPNLNFGVAPVPQALPDNPVSWGSFWMWGVPASSSNADVAWDFINFLGSEEAQLALHNEGAKFRSFGVPYSRVSLTTQLREDPYLGPVVESAPYAKSSELAARSGNSRVVEGLKEAINAVLNNKTDSLTALKNFSTGTPQPTD